MELMKNLRWICRVCTVNIKKRRSTQSAISIFETPELCEKLKRYLYIEIDPGDDLPKKICGNCFKRIESFHNFASLANKTENFLKDFIKIAKGNILSGRSTPSVDVDSLNQKFQSEFASFALLTSAATGINNDNKDSLFINNDDLPVNDAGELILNVSVSDPLIKDIENKIDLATKRRRKLEFIERNLNKVTITPTTTTSSTSTSAGGATGNTSLINSTEQVDVKNILQNRSRSLPENLLKSINNGAQATHNQKITSQLQHQQQQQQQQDAFNRHSPSATYDCLNLGSVIKDMDLLKLILKALKWPYTKDTLQIQIQKLKNTRLRDVITDPNLLQDTDMTQILRSYLSPAAALLQQQQLSLSSSSSPQHNNNSSTVFNSLTTNLSSPSGSTTTSTTASAATVAALNSLVSYRIPADTSVQLISVPSNDSKQNNTSYDHHNQDYYHFNEYNHNNYHHNNHYNNDQQNILSTTMTSMKSFSKIRRLSSTASPIIVSDDDNDSNNDNDIDNDNNDVQLFEVSVDPRLYFPGDKEFFFNQYNNTDTYMENYSPNTTKSSSFNYKKDQNDMNLKSKTKVRKKQKKKESTTITGSGGRNSKNSKNSKRKSSGQQKHQQNITAATTTAGGTVATTTKTKKSTCIKSTIIQDDEGFKDFDIDSITLIEEASGDDEVWAEFKVTESPEHEADNRPNEQLIHIKKETIDNDIENSLSSQNISNNNTNSTIITNTLQIDKKSIIENDKMIKNKIKPKTEITTTDEESSLKTLETQLNSISKINKNTNPNNSSSTKSEQQQNCEPIKKKATKRKNAQQKITRVSPRTATSSTTTTLVGEVTTTTTTNSRITRPKSPRNYFNKRTQRNKKETSESPKSQTDKKQQKVTTVEKEEVAQSSRKSNARKRICKQCGLTFTNIIDFVEHRKEHM